MTTPNPDPAALVAEIEARRHVPNDPIAMEWCRRCGENWPCSATRAASALRDVLAERDRLRTALELADEWADLFERFDNPQTQRDRVMVTSGEAHRLKRAAKDAYRYRAALAGDPPMGQDGGEDG